MSGFLFALLAAMVAGVAARDQALVASLSARQGPRVSVLLVGIAVSFATAALVAWAAAAMLPTMPPEARRLFAAMACGLAGIECLMIVPGREPEEPTRSLAAVGIVLFAHQIVDAARFMVFAIALATSAPLTAGLGGAIGGSVSLGFGWGAGGHLAPRATIAVRRAVGGVLLLIGAFLALAARGLL